MEEKVSVWKANLTNGLILGLIAVVYSLVMYFLDLYFNRTQSYLLLLVLIVTLYFLVKSYRDNYLHGYITFGQAVGAGVVIFLYFSIISAIFTYILYAVIDPELTSKQLAFTEEMLSKRGMPQEALDAAMKMQEKFIKPGLMVPFSILANMFYGTIMSLLVAIFVRKEGNPLIDVPGAK
jgi:hypothetical protein